MDIYAETILDHYRHPRAKNPLPSATVEHTETNVSCGDTVTLQLELTDGKIVGIGWSGEGCAISQAGMSMLTEELIGKSEEEVNVLTKESIYELLGVPIGPRRFKCALLCLHTVKNAMRKAHGEEPQAWTRTVMIEE